MEVWFYDSGEPDTFGGVIAAPSSPSDPTGSAEFGIFPSDQFGGHGGGSTHYTYYTGTGDWARQNSGIARSKGWHKVVFQFTPAGGSIHFDDKLVAKSPNMQIRQAALPGQSLGRVEADVLRRRFRPRTRRSRPQIGIARKKGPPCRWSRSIA